MSLYADRPTADVRPTDDVDILIEILDYEGYTSIEEKLRSKGFVNDKESGVICRYKVQGITVDVMPTSADILGFVNRWYKEGISKSTPITIDENISIRIFSAPYFLATKIEAFKNRGIVDGRMSTDFEDIVFLLNNRTVIWEELLSQERGLTMYLHQELIELLSNTYLEEWISAHLDYHEQQE